MSMTIDQTVGEIATNEPLATRVFARHNIDYCCGGGRALSEACEDKGLDAGSILEEIEKELGAAEGSEVNWSEASAQDLIDHIIAVYHRPLQEELPRLDAMAQKVLNVHGDKDPEKFGKIARVFGALRAELEEHLMKEEQILFPMILAGQGFMADGPISVMHIEHDSAGDALRTLRELTDDYQPAPEACNTWRSLWHGLGVLEEEIHRHIHLENNILFPAALKS